ncbi:MAG: hypothetical protein FWG37_04340, partial [Clostridia bacterium]|nr:hypothetical protein [Clostridia bacterium]
MEKILNQLYCGEIRPLEESYPTGSNYQELRQQFNAKNDLLADMLNDHGRELLTEIVDLRTQMDRFMDVAEFSKGFRL